MNDVKTPIPMTKESAGNFFEDFALGQIIDAARHAP